MNRSRTRSQAARGKGMPGWLVPVGVGVVAAALIAGVFLVNGDDTPEAAPDQPTSAATDQTAEPTTAREPDQIDLTQFESRDEGDVLALGETDAPVAMIVMSDYQCRYCAQWHRETLPKLLEYVDRGELLIEFRQANVFGAPSERAARAEYAAAKQGRLHEFQLALFPDGEIVAESQLSDDGLAEIAAEVGLDTELFGTDYASEETAAAVQANANFTASLGVYSTPTFILGGQPVVGAQPTEVFLDALDEALAAAN